MSDRHPIRPWLFDLREPGTPPPPPGGPDEGDSATDRLPDDTLGLALSGGGIRSATFALGIVQSLARHDWLRRVDYLSTVSGGGYLGAFLGRFFDLLGRRDGLAGPWPDDTPGRAQTRVREELLDPDSRITGWLRRHSTYLAPGGSGDALFNFTAFWRNFLSLHFVLVFFFLALFLLTAAVGYADAPGEVVAVVTLTLLVVVAGIVREAEGWTRILAVVTGLALVVVTIAVGRAEWTGEAVSASAGLVEAATPLTELVQPTWSETWWRVGEVLLWFAVVPLAVGYWLASQDRHEEFVLVVLLIAALLAGSILLAGATPVGLVVLVAAVLWVLGGWRQIRLREGRSHRGNSFRRARIRNLLTHRLVFWSVAAVAVVGLAVVDGAGQWLFRLLVEGTVDLRWIGGLGVGLLALAPMLRGLADLRAGRRGGVARSGLLRRLAAVPYLAPAAMLLLGVVPPLLALSFFSHLAFGLGATWWTGAAALLVTVLVAALLGTEEALPVVNRSGPLSIYVARLTRAFLGAVNPHRRRHLEGADVTHLVRGDDLSFVSYKPHRAGGPLHLVNCAVNETVDVASQRGLRDRQAENFAIGPAGISVAGRWHARWVERGADDGGDTSEPLPLGRGETDRLRPIVSDDEAHPLRERPDDRDPHVDAAPVLDVERLSLGRWTGISGAAVSPGMGRRTGPASALLLTLGNLRLGHWWDTGLERRGRLRPEERPGIPRRIAASIKRQLRAQRLLLAELRGRFSGPWDRYWYLSDGGHFEGTGAYELLRRRVPYVIASVADEDRERRGGDFARLVRIARIDLGCAFTCVSESAESLIDHGVPAHVHEHLGSLEDLLGPDEGDRLSSAHAALYLVRHPAPPEDDDGDGRGDDDPWHGRRTTWLLVLKATCTGDEPPDIRAYRAEHPDFPCQSTLDQAFDEPQWEAYRRLGEHVGDCIFREQHPA